jgi:Uma2 family endonuclease
VTLLTEQPPKPAPVRWTKKRFYDIAEVGGFRGQRIVLHRGELIAMPAMGWLHINGVAQADRLLQRRLPQFMIHAQMSFEVPGDYAPEPDIAVMTMEAARRQPRPNTAALIIEVSDSSVELDREKAPAYAAAQVPEYWLLNLVARQLEVYWDIVADPASETGYRYGPPTIFGELDSVAPLVDPNVIIRVAELLP